MDQIYAGPLAHIQTVLGYDLQGVRISVKCNIVFALTGKKKVPCSETRPVVGRCSAVLSRVGILWVLEAEHSSLQATSAERLAKGRAALWYIERSALFGLPDCDFPLVRDTKRLRSSASQEARGQGWFSSFIYTGRRSS